jgi:hypothetical protein
MEQACLDRAFVRAGGCGPRRDVRTAFVNRLRSKSEARQQPESFMLFTINEIDLTEAAKVNCFFG